MDNSLDRLVDLLVDNAMVWVSGTKAATDLGVPHSTVRSWMERLRGMGVDIFGAPGRGYLLKTIPDILTQEVIRRAARGTQFGGRIHHYYAIGSTMDAASELAQRGEPHGAIILAEEQSAGRGRFGRSWHSARSAGIYLSLILRPKMPAAHAPALALATALAVADCVAETVGSAVDLRWPNDVLLKGRKCSGILPEMTAEAERVRHIVLGIGLNVNQQRFPPELAEEATTLAAAAGRRLSRAEVLAALLRALDRRYRLFFEAGVEAVLTEFQHRSSFVAGRRVSVENDGDRFTGQTEGLDGAGFLRVRRDDTGRVDTVYTGKIRPEE